MDQGEGDPRTESWWGQPQKRKKGVGPVPDGERRPEAASSAPHSRSRKERR